MTIAGYRDVMNQLLDKLGPDPRKYDAALVRGVMQAETGVDASVRLRLEVLSVAPVSDVLHCHRDAAAFVGVLQEIGECPDLSQDVLRTVPACDCGCLAAGGLGVPGAWLRPHLHVPEPFITPVPIKSKPNVQVNRENFL